MCNECARCDGDLCTYFDNYSDRESTIACILFEPRKKPTLFNRITQSEERLAETYMFNHDGKVFKSLLLPHMVFNSREEAHAATVAKLNAPAESETTNEY